MKTVLYQIFKQRFLQEGCEINNKILEDKISEVSLRNLESNNWTLLLLLLLLLLFIILIEVLENYISIPIFIL
jgi:hypothetical protein